MEDALLSEQWDVFECSLTFKDSFYRSHFRFVHLVFRCVWTHPERLLLVLMIYTIAAICKEQNSVIRAAFLLVVVLYFVRS